MKKLYCLVMLLTLVVGVDLKARLNKKTPVPRRQAQTALTTAPSGDYFSALDRALADASQGQLVRAATTLFQLRRRDELISKHPLIYYRLGQILMDLHLPQVAAWQFVNVIKMGHNEYTTAALSALAQAADSLGDETILNYAMGKMKVSEFPNENRDMLFYRMGEMKMIAGDYPTAVAAFDKVGNTTKYADSALYNKAMAYAYAGDTENAIAGFNQLLKNNQKLGVTDNLRVSAIMGLARTFYQKKNFEKALYFYRMVPRDHELWHDALFESSWAYLRAAKFRSALGQFQSLHSSYYDDFYFPESLMLRAIVYMYICKFDEIPKVLGLFDQSYGEAKNKISQFLTSVRDPQEYFKEIEKGLLIRNSIKNGMIPTSGKLPYNVVRYIIGRQNIKRNIEYLKALYFERNRLEGMPAAFTNSSLGRYAAKIIVHRIENTKVSIAAKMKGHLVVMRADLKDFYEQIGFLRVELINGQKERLQKRILDRDVKPRTVDENTSRDDYVKNGYEYYPFRGEYWLDEIGNYFYLGRQSCE